MQAILDFFTGFAESIGAVIGFLVDMVKDLVYLVKLTGTFLAKIPQYFVWLPPQYLATIVLIFGVVVLYKVLGREG